MNQDSIHSSFYLVLIALFLFIGICQAQKVDQPDTGREASSRLTDEPDDSHLIESAFKVLYQLKTDEPQAVKTKDLEDLLKRLEEYETTHPQDIRSILYLRAECYEKLGRFKEAYIVFFRLKMRMDSTNDPLYPLVESRMNDLVKNVKPIELPKGPQFEYRPLPYYLAVAFVIMVLVIYFVDQKSLKEDDPEEIVYDSRILPEDKIMTLEEMGEQDGRCSIDALHEYRDLKPGEWETLSENQREKLKNAQLIVEGHRMILEVNKLPPYPLKMLSKLPIIGNWSPFWRQTVFGFSFVGFWYLCNYWIGTSNIMTPMSYFLLSAFVISSLAGIQIMAAKTVEAIDELVCMLEPGPKLKSISHLKNWITRLFRSPRQLYFFAFIMPIIVYTLYIGGDLVEVDAQGNPTGFNINIFFFVFLVWLTASLVWFLIGSLIMMNRVYNLKDLSMNPLAPSKTIGLEKWISVIGTYNMVCSMVLSFGCAIPVYFNYLAGKKTIYGSFWFFIITPLLIFYWIYPYIKIGNLVKSKKIKRMNFIKTKIAILFNEWVNSENKILKYTETEKELGFDSSDFQLENETAKIHQKLEGMEKYYNVFKKIEDSPESYFDIGSALELGKALGVPSLFAIITALLSLF